MADKSKTIKNATDKELDALMIRLEKERRIQILVSDLIRTSTPESTNPYGVDSYKSPTVSTESPIESMYHFGTRGMKWGVRNSERKANRKELNSQMQKMQRDQIRHPIASTTEQIKFITKNPLRALNMNVASAKKLNANVDARVKAKSRNESADSKVASKLKQKGMKSLSNDQLKQLNTRLQLEKQYKDLKPSDVKKGAKVAKNILKVGTTASSVYALAKSPLAQDVAKAIKKKG